MTDEASYKVPRGQRSGTGSSSVLRYLMDDLRAKDVQPATASPQGDIVSVQPPLSPSMRITPAGHAKE
jgi:hypothetical protein